MCETLGIVSSSVPGRSRDKAETIQRDLFLEKVVSGWICTGKSDGRLRSKAQKQKGWVGFESQDFI